MVGVLVLGGGRKKNYCEVIFVEVNLKLTIRRFKPGLTEDKFLLLGIRTI